MSDLEKISESDESYQRDLYNQHKDEIINFLQHGKYTFFPEIILSVAMNRSKKAEDVIMSVNNDKTFRSKKFDGFSLGSSCQKLGSLDDTDDVRAPIHFNRAILDIETDRKIFSRIDGNHRLSATEDAEQEKTKIPFCIIFFQDEDYSRKVSRILFTNINYKHIPLTSEDNYRLILCPYSTQDGRESLLYTSDELGKEFGKHFIKAREGLENLPLNNLNNIESILQKDGEDIYKKTAIVDFYEIADKRKINTKNLSLKKALQAVEAYYREYIPDKVSSNYQLLVAHLLLLYEDKNKNTNKLKRFSNWIKENNLYQLENIDAEGVIELYDKIEKSRDRTIFLAMAFSPAAKQNYKAIEAAVKDVNLGINLIRIDKKPKRATYSITDEIIKTIKESGYLIADLTMGSKNVYHEIGIKMASGGEFLLVHNDGVKGSSYGSDIGSNIRHLNILGVKTDNELREKVKDALKKRYRIS